MSKPSPWYRHFWPWFILVLMVVSVGASLATVVIAYGLGDLEIHESRPAAVAAPSVSTNGSAVP